jgi:outer membrane protein assembly factor BamB
MEDDHMSFRIERIFRAAGLLLFAIALVSLAGPATAAGQDWPQWRGADSTGISSEKGFITKFPADGPKQLWKKALGFSCSTLAVRDGRVYTMGNIDDMENVYCLNAKTGDEIWKHSYPCKNDPKNFEGGAGATPTLDGNRVYTLSRQGHLDCLNIETGKPIWSKNAIKDWGAKKPMWGFACSSLVRGNMLIVMTDYVLALNKMTGEIIWKTPEPVKANYSTPLEFKCSGKSYIAAFVPDWLIVYETKTGKEVDRYPFVTKYKCNIATPIVKGNEIFIAAGYNHGSALVRLEKGKLVKVWETKLMQNHFNSSILWKGNLYGFDQKDLLCMDWKTGTSKWSYRGLGKGSLMIADGKLIIQGEKGKLAIANASPEAYQELTSAKVLNKRCWVVPVLSNGRIYCRNNNGDTICLDVKGK